MEKHDKPFEMTSEGHFVYQVWRIFNSINHNKIMGTYDAFFNGVEALDQLLGNTYGKNDRDYEKEKDKLVDKFYDERGNLKGNPQQNKGEVKFHYYNELYEILIRLLGRTPLMPVKVVEGVIEEDDFKDV